MVNRAGPMLATPDHSETETAELIALLPEHRQPAAWADYERLKAQVRQEDTPPSDGNPAVADLDAKRDDADDTMLPPAEADMVRRGHARIAARLAAAHGIDAERKRGHLMHVDGLGWLYYDGKRWNTDGAEKVAANAVQAVVDKAATEALRLNGDAQKALQADVRQCNSANGNAGVLRLAATLSELSAGVNQLDADPYLLNVANGTLDLHNTELRHHNPADRITKVTRAAYDPAAPAPTWARFLAEVLPGEDVRAYLQRLVGVALLGKVIEHILPLLTGTGRNGKGTLYEALLWALDDYGLMAEPDLFLSRPGAHTTGQVDLMGCRLVVVSESNRADRLDESKMKRLIGGDRIKARTAVRCVNLWT